MSAFPFSPELGESIPFLRIAFGFLDKSKNSPSPSPATKAPSSGFVRSVGHLCAPSPLWLPSPQLFTSEPPLLAAAAIRRQRRSSPMRRCSRCGRRRASWHCTSLGACEPLVPQAVPVTVEVDDGVLLGRLGRGTAFRTSQGISLLGERVFLFSGWQDWSGCLDGKQVVQYSSAVADHVQPLFLVLHDPNHHLCMISSFNHMIPWHPLAHWTWIFKNGAHLQKVCSLNRELNRHSSCIFPRNQT